MEPLIGKWFLGGQSRLRRGLGHATITLRKRGRIDRNDIAAEGPLDLRPCKRFDNPQRRLRLQTLQENLQGCPAGFRGLSCRVSYSRGVRIQIGRLLNWLLRPRIQILERDSSCDPARLMPIGWLLWRDIGVTLGHGGRTRVMGVWIPLKGP